MKRVSSFNSSVNADFNRQIVSPRFRSQNRNPRRDALQGGVLPEPFHAHGRARGNLRYVNRLPGRLCQLLALT